MVMHVIFLMIAVCTCYTITSLSDKYAVAKAKFTGNEFTFLMCSSMAVFLCFTLPFQKVYFAKTWQSVLAVLLIAACKLLEFQMSALVLKQLSAFELKAWLGVTLFVSYITDVVCGADLRIIKIISIVITVIGLICIAKSGREGKINYPAIAIPLVLYLGVKYGYGLVIKSFSTYVSPTLQLWFAMILVAIVMAFFCKPKEILAKNRRGAFWVVLARIPNTVGMLLENAIIAISLANYSFVQPMILVSLFFIGILRKEKHTRQNLIGSVICVIGVILFQVMQ